MRDRPDSTAIPDEDSPLLPELAQFLETAGINHPFTKVCAALRDVLCGAHASHRWTHT
eukprot:COSAG06_NODE_35359_length_461_cov_0.679558_1_plen_57_part_01